MIKVWRSAQSEVEYRRSVRQISLGIAFIRYWELRREDVDKNFPDETEQSPGAVKRLFGQAQAWLRSPVR
ncbi:hypothetical protein SAMN05421748_12843 [Paractinoplanes atraurantiacus]|uniref:Uncharacterized protein n=1 Tax=Paractinoplanes atraurantiacus TaxID=1036182 RepID=A0A285JYN2_9ACTN|nr:hypothetical protein SAMN05421748_12843 [Actinoplanes atraurantiacus]